MGVIESKIEYSKLSVRDSEIMLRRLRDIGAGKVFTARARGSRMSDFQSMSDELSACLQFPYYYGNNWDAFNECIGDLEWLLLFAEEIFLLIEDFDRVFPGNSEDFRILMKRLEGAIQAHGNNAEGHQRLRIVLSTTDGGYENLQSRLEELNIRLSEFRESIPRETVDKSVQSPASQLISPYSDAFSLPSPRLFAGHRSLAIACLSLGS